MRERGVRYGSTGPGDFVVDAVPRLFTRDGVGRAGARARAAHARARRLPARRLRRAQDRRRGQGPAAADRGRLVLRARHAGPRPAGVGGLRRARRDPRRAPASSACWRTTCACRPGSASRRWPGSWSASCSARRCRSASPPTTARRSSASRRSCARRRPAATAIPSIVVLGDGFENDAQWEISEVAFRMGVPMVTLDDLSDRDGRAYAPRRRQAPPGRRRLPALELPPAARGGRPPERARPQAARADAARHGGGRQPARRRDRRRQARPRLRAGDDPLLPRRGAAAGLGATPTT